MVLVGPPHGLFNYKDTKPLMSSLLVFKEVLRREIQGLKVYPDDGSPVFSMTGTYF